MEGKGEVGRERSHAAHQRDVLPDQRTAGPRPRHPVPSGSHRPAQGGEQSDGNAGLLISVIVNALLNSLALSPSRAGSFKTARVVFVLLGALLLLGERVTWQEGLGAALLMTAGVAVDAVR